jgi:hypothetical protein
MLSPRESGVSIGILVELLISVFMPIAFTMSSAYIGCDMVIRCPSLDVRI